GVDVQDEDARRRAGQDRDVVGAGAGPGLDDLLLGAHPLGLLPLLRQGHLAAACARGVVRRQNDPAAAVPGEGTGLLRVHAPSLTLRGVARYSSTSDWR